MASRLRVLLISSVCVAFGGVSGAHAATDQAEMFIQAFSQSCESWGGFTRESMRLSRAYSDVLRQIKTDPNCSAIADSIDTVHELVEGMNGFGQDKDDKLFKERRANAFQGELFSSLFKASVYQPFSWNNSPQLFNSTFPGPTFSGITSSLGLAFAASKGVEIARFEDEIKRDRANHAATGEYFRRILPALSASKQCFVAHPNVPVALISHTLTLLGANLGGSAFGSEVGAAMRTIGALLNGLTEYARTARVDDALRDNIKVPLYLSVSCGLEAMVNNYCRTTDAQALFDSQTREVIGKMEPKKLEMWEGMELLTRNYAALRTWFQHLEAGTASQSDERARRNARIRAQVERVRAVGELIAAEYGDRMDEYIRINPADSSAKIQRVSVVQRFVKDITRKAFEDIRSPGGVDGSNPYFNFFSHESECAFQRNVYAGLGNAAPSSTVACEVLLANEAAKADDLAIVKDHMDVIQARINAIVQREKAIKLGPIFDPENTWLEGTRISTHGPMSNYDALLKIEEYLEKLKRRLEATVRKFPGRNNFRYEQEIHHVLEFQGTLVRVTDMMRAPAGRGPVGPQPISTLEKIQFVSDALKLSDNFDYFIDNMMGFVDVDLAERMRNNELDSNIADLLLLSVTEFNKRMFDRNGGVPDTISINEDLDSAKEITIGALRSYTSFLGPQIVEAIKYFRTKNKPPTRDPRNPMPEPVYAHPAAPKLCMLALAADDKTIEKMTDDPFWGKLNGLAMTLKKACAEMSFYSTMHEVTQLKLSFADISKKPWEERVCALYDLKKKTRIFEMHTVIQKERKERFQE